MLRYICLGFSLLGHFLISSTASSSTEVLLSRVGISPEGTQLSWKERTEINAKNKRTILKIPAIDELTGALVRAHRHGINGKGWGALILETSGIFEDFRKLERFPDQFKEIDPETLKMNREKYMADEGTHGTSVTQVFHQMAPQASALIAHHLFLTKEEKELIKKDFSSDKFVAINMSFHLLAASPDSHLAIIKELVFTNPTRPKLLIVGAGNNRRTFDDSLPGEDHSPIARSAEILENTIFVGATDTRLAPADYTARPGKNKKIQESWISTLGIMRNLSFSPGLQDDLKLSDEKQEGTSFATPAVTGAAVLLVQYIHSKYAYMPTSKEIKEILLHSASRTFVVYDRTQPQAKITIYYDPEAPSINSRQQWKEIRDEYWRTHPYPQVYPIEAIGYEDHIKEQYGMGILDLNNAFLYADIKYTHDEWEPLKIRKKMLEVNYMKEKKSAKIIQKHFRTQKKKKEREEVAVV